MTEFNKSDIFEEKIQPLLDEARQICERERIPFFASACVKNNEKESKYINYMVGTYQFNIELKDDKIPKFVNVLNGFKTVPIDDMMEIDFETI